MFHLKEYFGDAHEFLYCVNNERESINQDEWPPDNLPILLNGIMFSTADLGYGDFVNILTGGLWDDNNIHPFTVEDGLLANEQRTFQGSSNRFVPAIVDLDSDDDLEVALSSLVDGQTMNVQIWDLDADYEESENELCCVEWSQFQNGPRHTGLYAQTYSGTLPEGYTIWRDRVIVEDQVTADSDHQLFLTAATPTVIEFNNTILWIRDSGGIPARLGPYPIVFKSNFPDAEWDIVYLAIAQPVPPDPAPPWPYSIQPENWRIESGEIIIESGNDLTFTGCVFKGNGGYTAISATDADVSFIDCTFEDYDQAIVLDSCTGTIENCTFENINFNAIKLVDCTYDLTIEDCEIHDIGGTAINMYNSNPDISNCEIYNIDCDVYGGALYCYNSSPHLRDNDVHDCEYAGLRATGGGYPKLTTWNLLDPHRNRFMDNNTAVHTPRTDSTWAEIIQASPSYLNIDYGHNDIINAAGDYLISNHSYSGTYTLYAAYNYWETPGGLGMDDFYPYGSVSYDPADSSANYIDNAEEEREAYELYVAATQLADSGRFEEADRGFRNIVNEYPGASSALPSLRQIMDLSPSVDAGYMDLYRYFSSVTDNNEVTALVMYSDRLANLCLINEGCLDEAIRNYEAALENIENHIDSLYYAIDHAHAVLQRLRNDDGDLDAIGNRKGNTAIQDQENKITRLMAELNNMPLPASLKEPVPVDHFLTGCYPNPFNSTTTVKFQLPADGLTKLRVFDLNGREVTVLHDTHTIAGNHSVIWDANGVASGVYIVNLETAECSESMKLVLCR